MAAGMRHSCGVRDDHGTIVCWGADESGQSSAPDGRFSAVTAGDKHSCGLRDDGTVECWGIRWTPAPDEQSCGLTHEGIVACWTVPWTPPPAGARHVALNDQPDPSSCRPHGVHRDVTAGFPLPEAAPEAEGTLRVAVVFVDFDDAPADHPVHEEAARGLPFMEEALESMSYGSLDIEFILLDRWLRAEHSLGHYLEDSDTDEIVSRAIDMEAVRLADPHFDFAGVDSLMVVMPSTHLGGGVAQGSIETEEGTVAKTLQVNAFPGQGEEGGYAWGWLGAHELLHNLGLVDMYPFDDFELAALPPGETWITAEFGVMGLQARYPAPIGDPRLIYVVRRPDRPTWTQYAQTSTAWEMLAWSRWQLGWLDQDQVLCIGEPYASFKLAPVADPGPDIAMAAIPVSRHEVIVLESRRQTGFDAPYTEPRSDGGHTVWPTLLTEGILVYTVDASISTGDLPVRALEDTGYQVVDDYPILAVGDRATVRDYAITVVADDGDTHIVTVARIGGIQLDNG